MESFVLEPGSDTPRVVMDAVNNVFEISQRSYPEDAVAFYAPVLQWLSAYIASPNSATAFTIDLEYYNTSSAKQLFRIFSLLNQLAKDKPVTVNWCYKKEDTDMRLSGERFAKLFQVPFNFIEN